MGTCCSKEGGKGRWKIDYFQKRDRIKMWMESVSSMEVFELRSPPKLVRTHAVADISALPGAKSQTSMNSTLSYSSSCIFFDAREYADSGDDDEESRSEDDDTIFHEAITSKNQTPVGGLLAQGRRRELPMAITSWNIVSSSSDLDSSSSLST